LWDPDGLAGGERRQRAEAVVRQQLLKTVELN
jgi:hypothetical protein